MYNNNEKATLLTLFKKERKEVSSAVIEKRGKKKDGASNLKDQGRLTFSPLGCDQKEGGGEVPVIKKKKGRLSWCVLAEGVPLHVSFVGFPPEDKKGEAFFDRERKGPGGEMRTGLFPVLLTPCCTLRKGQYMEDRGQKEGVNLASLTIIITKPCMYPPNPKRRATTRKKRDRLSPASLSTKKSYSVRRPRKREGTKNEGAHGTRLGAGKRGRCPGQAREERKGLLTPVPKQTAGCAFLAADFISWEKVAQKKENQLNDAQKKRMGDLILPVFVATTFIKKKEGNNDDGPNPPRLIGKRETTTTRKEGKKKKKRGGKGNLSWFGQRQ